MVTPAMKQQAQNIAAAMTNSEQRWTETDVWEEGVAYLATRKDVREALAKAGEEVG